MKKLSFVTILLASVLAYGSNYFVEPSAAFVMPSDSGLSYHGMNGTVQYKDGYSVGLNAGRYYGPFKLYVSYDYTNWRAKIMNLQTPLGELNQSVTDLYQQHNFMLNLDRDIFNYNGFVFYLGGGAGISMDDTTAIIGEARLGLRFKGLSVYYSSRITDGKITYGATNNIQEPSLNVFGFAYSFNF